MCHRGSLTGWECQDTTGPPPMPGTNSKTTYFLLLTPGAQPAPPPSPNPDGGGGSRNEQNASGSSGSRSGIGKGQEEGWGVLTTGWPPRGSLSAQPTYFHYGLLGTHKWKVPPWEEGQTSPFPLGCPFLLSIMGDGLDDLQDPS